MPPRSFSPRPLNRGRHALVSLAVTLVAASLLFVTHSSGSAPWFPLRASSQAATSTGVEPTKKEAFVAGEILVRFRSDAVVAKATDVFGKRAEMSLTSGRPISLAVERLSAGPEIVEGLRVARVAPAETNRVIEALRARSDVLYAEPNYLRFKQALPNDSRFAEQWGLKNTGQSGGFSGIDIKAEQAWDITTGSRSVVVGIVDQGIDINHPDLRDNIWINPGEIAGNGIDDDGNGYIDDVNGWDFVHNDNTVFDYALGTYPAPANYTEDIDDHGTHVAGTIGASGNNGVGVTGVNWQVSLMSLKFLGPNGGSTADLLKALAYAKTMRDLWTSSGGARGANIRVLNNSYGGGGFSQAELEAIRSLASSGTLFVVAAGNEGRNNDIFPVYPASYISPNVVSVAALTRANQPATFSNTGPATVDIWAPGQSILSTTPGGTYSTFSGTSMATPHVSGVAALVCAAFPGISLQRLRSALLYNGGAFYVSVSSRRFLNALAAVQNPAISDNTPPAAVGRFRIENFSTYPNYRLAWTAPGDDGNSGTIALYQVRFSETDLTDPAVFELARPMVAPFPSAAGWEFEFQDLQIPYRHNSGFLGVRAIDKVGNAGPISAVPVSADPNLNDPYLISETAPEPLSTGGTPLGLIADEGSKSVALPFPLLAFGQSSVNSVVVSTNGTIYFGYSQLSNGDYRHSLSELTGSPVIAGLWDDLRTDRRPGDDVYVVKPDRDRIIFRWQAVTYNTIISPGVTRGENPVNFEVELRSDGSITMRYGEGNHNLVPVVGIGGGRADPYLVETHSAASPFKDLTNAATVNVVLRKPTPPPAADITLTMQVTPDAVASGKQITYKLSAGNRSYLTAPNFVLTNELPAGTSFVSCSVEYWGTGTCTPPPPGSRTVTATTAVDGSLQYTDSNLFVLTIVAQVNAPPGTILTDTASANSLWRDPQPANNNASLSTDVIEDLPLANLVEVACGWHHTLAVKNDGSVWAWGSGGAGELGNGTAVGSSTVVPVNALSNVTAVAAGNAFSLARTSAGDVWAWGFNFSGQLGTGEHVIQRTSPVRLNGISGVTAVAAGGRHSLALKNDGTVWAWGANDMGQAGVNSETPAKVPGLTSIIAIAAGDFHSLAIKADGTVWAWGDNSAGQVTGSVSSNVMTPTQVAGISDAVSATAGTAHSLVQTSGGTIRTWGSNAYGSLGTGTGGSFFPGIHEVINLSGVTSVNGGGYSSFALKPDHTLWAWGENYGRFGNGTTNESSYSPIQITSVSQVQKLSAGQNHTAAILTDGTLRTWGANESGQLGDGSHFARTSPVSVGVTLIVLTPAISQSGGSGGIGYFSPIVVRVDCYTPGATIHFTTNGNDPTETDPVFVSGTSMYIGQTMIFKVRAFRSGWIRSRVASASYELPLNPIDDAAPFVRQHYLDFLGREPDQGGADYWTAQITQCGTNLSCINAQRIGVSAAFFIELEFQQTGSVVYRMHRAAFGTMENAGIIARLYYTQFRDDRAQLVGGAGLQQSTINYANSFAQSSLFRSEYSDYYLFTNSDFLDKLFLKANLAGPANDALKQTELTAMNTSGKTRAQVLLDVIELPEFKDREYKPSFVLMQYFGYLHRDPDQGGYQFWLNILNNKLPNDPTGYRAMVCAFITSNEYQFRFGIGFSRTNLDCSP